MGQAKKKRKKNPRHGVPDNVPNDFLVNEIEQNRFVKASQLSQFKIRGVIHLWQVLNGNIKSFTNSPQLVLLEKTAGFNWIEFFRLMSDNQGTDGSLNDGFYWVNHFTRQNGFFPCKNWTKDAENFLLQEKVIEL